jgi:hypothetical protein
MGQRFIKQGPGWRIGWNEESAIYKGLVGSDDWAIELTETEFRDFCRLVLQLGETMEQMQAELMAEETITCEVQSDLIWLEVVGFPSAYSLRLLVEQGRRCEGNWQESAVKAMTAAIQVFNGF